MIVRVPGCTVRLAVPVAEDIVAEMLVLPAELFAVASPFVGTLVLIVATDWFEELQVTWVVMFCVLRSE